MFAAIRAEAYELGARRAGRELGRGARRRPAAPPTRSRGGGDDARGASDGWGERAAVASGGGARRGLLPDAGLGRAPLGALTHRTAVFGPTRISFETKQQLSRRHLNTVAFWNKVACTHHISNSHEQPAPRPLEFHVTVLRATALQTVGTRISSRSHWRLLGVALVPVRVGRTGAGRRWCVCVGGVGVDVDARGVDVGGGVGR